MSIIKLIKNYGKKKRLLFTTPSHNQGIFIPPKCKNLLGEKYFKSDYSEIEGFDNLSAPTGAIKEAQKKAAQIYEAGNSFFLTNGSTSGILASMIATLAQNDSVLIARNCHKSIYSGLVLTGAYPIWLTPQFDKEWGIFKPIKYTDVEKALNENPQIKVFIMTNPSYEGVISNVNKIAEICNEKNVILIVDEAHGALWNFDKTIGTPAIYSKADITIQSLHKTAGAINPAAIMHLSFDSKVPSEKIQKALNLINTTSPSYPLLLDIESTIDFLGSKAGKKQIAKLIDEIVKFKNDLSKQENLHIYYDNNDITKILVKIDGLSGFELSDILFNKYKIEDELANDKSVLFLTGIGTDKKKLTKLKKALAKISKKALKENKIIDDNSNYVNIEPKVVFAPANVYNQDSIEFQKEDAVGKIANELIVNYPPGMPILIPGELVQEAHLPFLKDKDTLKVLN
ncbi:MAG: aminotransferase class I/II-fold pyridoxal phosphate-dependent enzyme [Candidatus Gastranaerophilales bacterium]|nr:aminotransferase class I/II-fold pyridoxal phosphate-dependent enzyme [Candidatus Gastranaerophilales bacterium]